MKLKTALMGAVATFAVAQMAYADAHEGERGRDGEVKIIYWQAPSILNPFLSGGTKDIEAASLVIEPLARYNSSSSSLSFFSIRSIRPFQPSSLITRRNWRL